MGDVWKALADPTRRKILKLLKKDSLNAGEIARLTAIQIKCLAKSSLQK